MAELAAVLQSMFSDEMKVVRPRNVSPRSKQVSLGGTSGKASGSGVPATDSPPYRGGQNALDRSGAPGGGDLQNLARMLNNDEAVSLERRVSGGRHKRLGRKSRNHHRLAWVSILNCCGESALAFPNTAIGDNRSLFVGANFEFSSAVPEPSLGHDDPWLRRRGFMAYHRSRKSIAFAAS